MSALVIELSGTDTATCGDMSVTWKNCPIGRLARKLVEAGFHPGRTVLIQRNGVNCFEPDTLSAWANRSVSETDRHSPRFIKYTPFDRKVLA